MSEDSPGYMDLELALKSLETRLLTIATDPTASRWLKQAITELWQRDVVDAINDLDTLRELLEIKRRTDLLLLERWAASHEGTRH